MSDVLLELTGKSLTIPLFVSLNFRVHSNSKMAHSLAIFDLKITLVQVSASVSTTYKILFLVTFVVTFCPVMQGALFKINLLHICRKKKIKSGKLANCHFRPVGTHTNDFTVH